VQVLPPGRSRVRRAVSGSLSLGASSLCGTSGTPLNRETGLDSAHRFAILIVRKGFRGLDNCIVLRVTGERRGRNHGGTRRTRNHSRSPGLEWSSVFCTIHSKGANHFLSTTTTATLQTYLKRYPLFPKLWAADLLLHLALCNANEQKIHNRL
jgi:hypothetical protein